MGIAENRSVPTVDARGLQEKPIPLGPSAFVEERTRRGLKPGQLDPETADFAHRLRELTGRRSYLRNFWYAAGARPRRPAQCVRNCIVRLNVCILDAMSLYQRIYLGDSSLFTDT